MWTESIISFIESGLRANCSCNARSDQINSNQCFCCCFLFSLLLSFWSNILFVETTMSSTQDFKSSPRATNDKIQQREQLNNMCAYSEFVFRQFLVGILIWGLWTEKWFPTCTEYSHRLINTTRDIGKRHRYVFCGVWCCRIYVIIVNLYYYYV